MITRDQALKIVQEHVKNKNLTKHMLAVEAAMAAYAKKFGEDEQQWRLAGLLHDFDWEIHPSLDKHPQAGAEILKSRGVDDDLIHTILSHADHTHIPREKLIDHALFACDEITGLIVAVALVRPDRKLASVTLDSIKKKWKVRTFAAGANRDDIAKGTKELGVGLWDHVDFVLKAMQGISKNLGL